MSVPQLTLSLFTNSQAPGMSATAAGHYKRTAQHEASFQRWGRRALGHMHLSGIWQGIRAMAIAAPLMPQNTFPSDWYPNL